MTTLDLASHALKRYEISHLYAMGGIGRVWAAHDRQLGRRVALKELRPEHAGDARLSARFLREAQITGQLEHPGIVPVYELSRCPETGQPCYAMRLVKGRTLEAAARSYHQKRRLGSVDTLEFANLCQAFALVCKTIAYAHSRGVIHRDLKGQNIIMGDYGEVIVLDWGLAKLMSPLKEEDVVSLPPFAANPTEVGKEDLTSQGDALGTPAYMSPEQAAGRLDEIDERTDVYGLGAMLYHILAGRPPFAGRTAKEILQFVQSTDPVHPDYFWPDVPPTLQAACLRALAKAPADRFASVAEFAHQVEQWQETQRKEAVEALRTSEALYHSLVESIPMCVWRKDVEGRFTFANEGFFTAFGKSPEELIGKDDFELFTPELAEKYRRDDATVIRTGQTLRIIEEQATAEGTRLVEVIKIPIRNAHGAITGTQGIFWDMTAWKRGQKELQDLPIRHRNW